jgi:hypothetical protein
MAGFDPSKFVDKDWQQAHSIDRPDLPCEVVQLANAVLVQTHRWMGEEAFEVSVIGHTLLCDVCKYRFWVWIELEQSFEDFVGLLGQLSQKLGDEMVKFLRNKYMLGSQQALSISCEEVQAALVECFHVKALPEDSDFAVAFIGHVCICQDCLGFLGQLMESFEAQQALLAGAPE